jgi:arylsulfatase
MAEQKPNILFIMGDDIGWYNISAYNLGVMGYRTPNIDRIEFQGIPASSEAGQLQSGSGDRKDDRSQSSLTFRVTPVAGCDRLDDRL